MLPAIGAVVKKSYKLLRSANSKDLSLQSNNSIGHHRRNALLSTHSTTKNHAATFNETLLGLLHLSSTRFRTFILIE